LAKQRDPLHSVNRPWPGDVLSTGSPAGVGGLMDPPRYLVAGDVVRVEIEGIGHIENRVVQEPLETAR
jgi:2-keto-4-pentenoate hydratase/2-oxohepta-3-ene-1,7-dioic acid hydratase in catechol pathway